MFVLIGTIQRFGGAGIGLVEIENDKIKLHWSDGQLNNPNWIHRGPNDRLFVACNNAPDPVCGSVAEISINRKGVRVHSIQAAGGTATCFLEHSLDGRFLLAANYSSGSFSVFPILKEGIGEKIQLIQHSGKGTHPTRQEAAHVHQVTAIPGTENRFCVVDLGLDALFIYEQNDEGLLRECYRIPVPSGQGPRHVCYDAKGNAYLVTELGNRIYPVIIGENEGKVIGDGVSTLKDTKLPNTASALWISNDENTVYASNRGEGTVVSFRLPKLELAGRYPTAGKAPRDFCLLGNGSILAACQDQGLSLLKNGEIIDVMDYPGAVSILPVKESTL